MDWTLGTFGDLRLDKGGGDPRTDGRAQNGLPAPTGWEPQRRAAGRPVLRQSEGDSGEDVEGWSALTGAACTGRHVLLIEDRSEVRFPTTVQRRRGLGPVKKDNAYGVLVHAMHAPAQAGDRGGRRQRVVSGPGRRRCVEPRRGEPGPASPAAAGGAGVGALGRHRRIGQAGGAVCRADDCGG